MNLRSLVFVGALLWSGLAFAGGLQYRLSVDGLACPFCAFGIEKQLTALDGVEDVQTSIEEGAVIVTMQEGQALAEDDANRAVRAAGFTLKAFEEAEPS